MHPCLMGMFDKSCYKSERHNALLSSGLRRHVLSPLATERKKSVWSRRLEVTKREFLFNTKKFLFLGLRQFRFLSEASRETVIFAFYLFHS